MRNRVGFKTVIFICMLAVSQYVIAADIGGISSAQQMYDGTLRPDVEVDTFSHYDRIFPTLTVPHGTSIRPLPASTRSLPAIKFTSGSKTYDMYDYLSLNRVAGLLIIKNGEVVTEDYELGINSSTRWASFSVAKSVASALMGAAIQDGFIKSLDDPITDYLPQLAGGPYSSVSIRNVMGMASGVNWDETYTDPKSDRRKLLIEQFKNQPGSVLRYMNGLKKSGEPGSIWNYNTGETFIVGAVLEAATKRPLATYLSEKLWVPLGMERDAAWQTESPGGMGMAGSGLSITLRDYGRFGQFVLDDGIINGHRVVPKNWFNEAGSPKFIGGKSVDYGYLWWPTPVGDPMHAGSFRAVGIFGQQIYINPKEKLVIVVLSARQKPLSAFTVINDLDFYGAAARALH